MNLKHGMSNTPTYIAWQGMKNRCRNKSNKNYGGRGIKFCRRWLHFKNFLSDMGIRPDGTSLERLDVNSGYSPENCIWADLSTQSNNRRTNRNITAYGLTATASTWQHLTGINADVIRHRTRTGWRPEAAVTRELNGNQLSCWRGHVRNQENTYIDSNGNRACRPCTTLAQARYEKRKKELANAQRQSEPGRTSEPRG